MCDPFSSEILTTPEEKMMEDTGEDILRAKPSPITTFFKRIGQVCYSKFGGGNTRSIVKSTQHFCQFCQSWI